MQQHFVIFHSPGTIFAEQSSKRIDSWNINEAVRMSKEIKESHGALPYGFCFVTRGRTNQELDSREIKRSGMYYLGGDVLTLDELKAKNDPDNTILISNMESNKLEKVVINTNSWKWTQALRDDDMVLSI